MNDDMAMLLLALSVLALGLWWLCNKCIRTEQRHEPDLENND